MQQNERENANANENEREREDERIIETATNVSDRIVVTFLSTCIYFMCMRKAKRKRDEQICTKGVW